MMILSAKLLPGIVSSPSIRDNNNNNICLLSKRSGSFYYTSPTGNSLFYARSRPEVFEGIRIDRPASPITSSNLFLSSSRKKTTPETAKLSKINSVVKAIKGSYGNSNTQKITTTTEEERFKNLLKSKENVTKIHFYIQDALGGSNPTVWEVARSPQTSSSPTTFGQVRVIDDLVTTQPDRNSEKLGRAQGIITFSDLNEPALTMNLNFYFTSGEYKGSSLCVVGRNPILNKNRELPIVGGTGIFRMARGYSISNTYSYDSVTNYGVLEYTLYVAYVDQGEELN